MRDDKVEILYSPADVLPVRFAGVQVLAVRNATLYTAYNMGWSFRDRARIVALRKIAIMSIDQADRIVFVSEDSRRWVSERIGIPLSKTDVLLHGVGKRFFECDSRSVSPRLESLTQGAPYVLSVSTVYRYKNYLRLIDAFDLAVDKGHLPHHLG